MCIRDRFRTAAKLPLNKKFFIKVRAVFEKYLTELKYNDIEKVYLQLYHVILNPPSYLERNEVPYVYSDLSEALQTNISPGHFHLLRVLLVTDTLALNRFIELLPTFEMLFESLVESGAAESFDNLLEIIQTLVFAAYNFPMLRVYFIKNRWAEFFLNMIGKKRFQSIRGLSKFY
eukprot:TRINITY_DN23027_c0_g1_i1.p1 TRINITY_DN23027_c0_g1~~TRINITY_DN23027_c0_g1_i1.p1  ORF type:complete len:190 (-),score=24.56 TRINITY_DN23027_c0_g1_i1:10-534(-)